MLQGVREAAINTKKPGGLFERGGELCEREPLGERGQAGPRGLHLVYYT